MPCDTAASFRTALKIVRRGIRAWILQDPALALPGSATGGLESHSGTPRFLGGDRSDGDFLAELLTVSPRQRLAMVGFVAPGPPSGRKPSGRIVDRVSSTRLEHVDDRAHGVRLVGYGMPGRSPQKPSAPPLSLCSRRISWCGFNRPACVILEVLEDRLPPASSARGTAGGIRPDEKGAAPNRSFGPALGMVPVPPVALPAVGPLIKPVRSWPEVGSILAPSDRFEPTEGRAGVHLPGFSARSLLMCFFKGAPPQSFPEFLSWCFPQDIPGFTPLYCL